MTKRSPTTKDIGLLHQLFLSKQLTLAPQFQRNAVWPRPAKAYLIDTVVNGLIRDFVGRKNDLPSEYPKEWYDEFAQLSETRRYFFSTNRYIFRASRAIGS